MGMDGMDRARGPLIILSGPSGSGKSTIIKRLLSDPALPLRLSVSATTRAPRPGEKEGVHYFFWTRDQFDHGVQEGAFLEWAEVFGNYYGTLKCEVDRFREQGIGVLLEIDVQGWQQVKQLVPDVVSIFLETPSLEEYETRLRARKTETEEAIQRRLRGARQELTFAPLYDYRVVNDDLEVAVAQIKALVRRQLAST